MKWISIEDRLPEYKTPVLGIDKFDEQKVCTLEKRWRDTPRSWWCGTSCCEMFFPTHWMPLPIPPNKEK